MDATRPLHQFDRAGLFDRWLVRSFQTGRARAVRSALCDVLSGSVCLSLLHTYRDLDLAIAFLRNAAFILAAPLFLHFCALYPTRQQLFPERRWRATVLY